MIKHALIPLLLIAGCGSDGSDQTAAAYKAYYATNLQHTCEAIFRCCTPTQAAAHGSDANDCSAKILANSQPYLTTFNAAFSAGTARYDPAAGNACAAAQSGALANCDGPLSLLALPAMCYTVIIGNQPLGAACDPSVPLTCAPGGFCKSGTCGQVAQLGEDCSTLSCYFNLVCLSDKKCHAPLADGQACANGSDCASGTCTNGSCDASPTVRQQICN